MQSQTDTAGELNGSAPNAAVNSGALPEQYELLNALQAMRVGDFSVRMRFERNVVAKPGRNRWRRGPSPWLDSGSAQGGTFKYGQGGTFKYGDESD